MPIYQLFSLVSVAIAGGLLMLAWLRPKRRGTWAFRMLAADLTLWQWAEYCKNAAVQPSSVEFWTRISFLCVTLVAPTFLWMVLRMTHRHRWRWGVVLPAAYTLSLLLVAADQAGWVLGKATRTPVGIIHEAYPIFWLFGFQYLAINGLALFLLYKARTPLAPSQLRLRLLFIAAAGGLALGLSDLLTILWRPQFPWANLSAAFYSIVLYWAVYRYNYMGGRGLLREALMRLGWGVIGALGASALVAAGYVLHQSHVLLGEAVAPSALVVAWLGPTVFAWLRHQYRQRFPVRQGSGLLLAMSRSSVGAHHEADIVVNALTMLQSHFRCKSALALRYDDPPRGWCALSGVLPLRVEPLLNRSLMNPLALRDLKDRLYRSESLSIQEWQAILRDYRLLRRLQSDVVIPISVDGKMVVLLCLQGWRGGMESWTETSALLQGLGQILADQLLLVRMGQAREREKHLGELGLMAAGLAHEIKNPLEGVYGAAQILQEEGKGNAHFVSMILRDSLRLNDVVHNFLRYARPYKAECEVQELSPLLQEWQGADCLVAESEKGLQVRCDASALHQILLNLLANARRVQPADIPLLVQVRSAETYVEIACIDQGGGVAPERIACLFEPFQTGSPQGNGLGLALSRKMARAMGGDLTFVPRDGGAEFCLRLPRG